MVWMSWLLLGKKQKSIYDNKEFIIEVLSYADNPEAQQTIIDFIDAGEDVDDETISVLAMDLADARAVSKNRVVNADGNLIQETFGFVNSSER